ncbi:LacI family DNA-binding transcriptional regulator [Curtobacterium flaccumfaciens]|uniref:LacI family DNA-binding transcriptional regulator n=1 Tax=Curtobacterium flaccumfaciens TaxID=2035 RepID=UPI001ADAB9D7|nr:LacI family DNA-binding transcriptional regulator [Curtobacterium flaccumfaciens]MBO9041961.1 LacI family DNA-binding transcriptional regulator [Curtobacterium flaccumfaciens pv. flaccumfaciens]
MKDLSTDGGGRTGGAAGTAGGAAAGARAAGTAAGAARRVTIRDIADATGVAASTVSRALSLPDRVNPVTQERIQRAARELGYVANSQARALTSGRTRAVAVLVSDITNPFYFDVIRGTQHQLAGAGWTQLLVDTEESADAEMAALTAVGAKADGVVLTASRLSDAQIARFAERIPLVVVNRRPTGVPSVLIDTPGGVEQAVQHLVSLGHREILYVAGPDSSWSNERRWRALVQVAKRLGIRVARVGPHAPFVDSGAAAADAAVHAGATACIAFNDLIAIGMLARLRERGVRVPEDMSIVGCDDIFGADFCNPPLTTMTSPIERAGRVAIRMLLGRLGALPADELPGEHMSGAVALPTHLTVRESTGPAPRAHND